MKFTQKWNSIYNDNNIKLIKFHIVLMILYGMFAIIFLSANMFLYTAVASIMSILHFVTIFLVKNKLEIGRKISEILAMIILIGFPIGTLIGYFMLPKTVWNKK